MNERVKNFNQQNQNPITFELNFQLKNLTAENITVAVKNFSQKLFEEFEFSINQVRKYYHEILAIKNRYETKEPDNKKLKLDMAIFLSKIEYGKNKAKSEKDKDAFEYYLANIELLIKQINDYTDFKSFLTVMEAIVAYFPKQN